MTWDAPISKFIMGLCAHDRRHTRFYLPVDTGSLVISWLPERIWYHEESDVNLLSNASTIKPENQQRSPLPLRVVADQLLTSMCNAHKLLLYVCFPNRELGGNERRHTASAICFYI